MRQRVGGGGVVHTGGRELARGSLRVQRGGGAWPSSRTMELARVVGRGVVPTTETAEGSLFSVSRGSAPRLRVAVGIPGRPVGGRDFQRVWEGPGVAAWRPGAFHARSDSAAGAGGGKVGSRRGDCVSVDGGKVADPKMAEDLRRVGGRVVVPTTGASTSRGWADGAPSQTSRIFHIDMAM